MALKLKSVVVHHNGSSKAEIMCAEKNKNVKLIIDEQ